MKKILVLSLALMLMSGVATASSKNGNFDGQAIVTVESYGNRIMAERVPAIVYKDQVMIPSYMLQKFGLTTEWNDAEYSVNLTKPKEQYELSLVRLQKISKSVGKIVAYKPDGSYTQGTGFSIDGGYFITASHVAHGSLRLEIELNGKEYDISGEPAFDNAQSDVYGIKLDVPATLSYITYEPEVGENVYAIGYPAGTFKIEKGNLKKVIYYWGTFLSTTIIEPGASGGPMVNLHGEVIGLTTAIQTTQGTKVAVSNSGSLMSLVQNEIDKLAK